MITATPAVIYEVVTNPLWGEGYAFWSGIGSGSPLLAAVGAWWHHNNCVQKGCWRKGHKDPQHGHPACRRHSRISQPPGSAHDATSGWTPVELADRDK